MGPRPEQMFVFARGTCAGSRCRSTAAAAPPSDNAGPAASRPTDRRSKIERGENIVVSMIEREDAGGRESMTRARPVRPLRRPLGADGQAPRRFARSGGGRGAQTNLLISSSVLLLLTLAIGLIVVSARRAQELARQQMEFVAAVSHELRTPVSVIGAAAGNLADGVVGDPQRVRKYGETIQGEARRLAETVERVLQLAGIAAGRAAAAQVPVAAADLVHESLGACRTEIDKRRRQGRDRDRRQPAASVVGDVAALKSALQNLISNAVKYGGDARWVRVSARPGTGSREPGSKWSSRSKITAWASKPRTASTSSSRSIAAAMAVSQQIQGSGLGLNLVMRIAEAHGGAVSVTSEPGKGSTFTHFAAGRRTIATAAESQRPSRRASKPPGPEPCPTSASFSLKTNPACSWR